MAAIKPSVAIRQHCTSQPQTDLGSSQKRVGLVASDFINSPSGKITLYF